jgi:hypothetical protein
VLPSSGATLSGTQFFDAVPNGSGDTGVQFNLTGGGCTGDCLVGNATLTWVGWVVQFNTENVPNGTYGLVATVFPDGTSSSNAVTVFNPPPTVAYPADGSTVSGSQWLDCVPPPGMTAVVFFVDHLDTPLYLTATLTWFGWVAAWTTSTFGNGPYTVSCEAFYPEGGTYFGPTIAVTVSN